MRQQQKLSKSALHYLRAQRLFPSHLFVLSFLSWAYNPVAEDNTNPLPIPPCKLVESITRMHFD